MLGLCCRTGFSLVVARGLLIAVASLVVEHGFWSVGASVVAAHGLKGCGSWALGHRLNSCGIWHVAPWHVGSSWIRDWTRVSCIGRRILYHWATREAPPLALYLIISEQPFSSQESRMPLNISNKVRPQYSPRWIYKVWAFAWNLSSQPQTQSQKIVTRR